MQNLLLVAVGGGTGAVLRYLVGVQAVRALGHGWPYGTQAVNAVGGVLLRGLWRRDMLRGGADQERWRLLIGVGVLGGFTTFSAFSLEVALMLQRRAWAEAFGYSLVSVGLSVAALFLGLALMRRVLM